MSKFIKLIQCPSCGLIYPRSAQRCDCGYIFLPEDLVLPKDIVEDEGRDEPGNIDAIEHFLAINPHIKEVVNGYGMTLQLPGLPPSEMEFLIDLYEKETSNQNLGYIGYKKDENKYVLITKNKEVVQNEAVDTMINNAFVDINEKRDRKVSSEAIEKNKRRSFYTIFVVFSLIIGLIIISHYYSIPDKVGLIFIPILLFGLYVPGVIFYLFRDHAKTVPDFKSILYVSTISVISLAIISFHLPNPFYGLLFFLYFVLVHSIQVYLEYIDECWFQESTLISKRITYFQTFPG